MAVVGATQLEPVNILGSYVQGLEMGRSNQLARQREMERQFEVEQQQKLQNALAGGLDITTPEGQAALAKFGPQGIAMAAQGAQLGQFAMQRKQVEREAAKQKLEDIIGMLRADPAQWQANRIRAGEMGFDITKIPEKPDQKWINGQLQALIPLRDQLEFELRGRTAEVQQRQVELAERKQRFEESQANQPSADDLVVARTETAADGTVRMYNKFGKLLKTEKGAGKPSAQFERSRAVKAETQKNLNEVISSLEDISKKDGLIDQSTGSGIGRGVDVVAGFFGQSTPGAEAIARLKPIADQVLKLVPRFEGPQSDKDTQSYREAAGQLGDPTLPSAVRKAAAKEIIDIYKRRRNQFTISGEELTVAPSEGWGNLEVVE